MKVPREFAVRGSIWRVEYKWNLTYNKQHVDGLTDPVNRIVFIDRSLTKEEKYWAFIHEWLHVVLEVYEIGHNSKKISYNAEESIVSVLESELKLNFSIKWRGDR
jgi:Zn-dependent peptidase ImmA (M78 family)